MGAMYEELVAELSPERRARVETRAATLIAEETSSSRRKARASGRKAKSQRKRVALLG